jgi:hypothetical protein
MGGLSSNNMVTCGDKEDGLASLRGVEEIG